LRFRVQGSGFRVQGLGFRVWAYALEEAMGCRRKFYFIKFNFEAFWIE
jgi:hypothetical protein